MGEINVRGFTLLELMVTLAVAIILITIAIPSYHNVVARNALAAGVNDLVGDLNYARSEAVTRGYKVYVCASSDQKACRDDNIWTGGWIVYTPKAGSSPSSSDTHNLLRVHGAINTGLTLTSNGSPSLSFNSSGFAMAGRTFTATRKNNGASTEIIVASTGRVRTSRTP